jgi:membrane-associated phospholipid phosphatase
MMPEWGFTDSVAHFTGVTDSTNALYNPFAAVPSMHVAFSLMIGVSMIRMITRPWAKALWGIYPFVVTFVVIATANHWWFDAALGALTAAASAWAAWALFARARPDAWAWQPLATADGRVAA